MKTKVGGEQRYLRAASGRTRGTGQKQNVSGHFHADYDDAAVNRSSLNPEGVMQHSEECHTHTSAGGQAHPLLAIQHPDSSLTAYRIVSPGFMTNVCHTCDGDNVERHLEMGSLAN